MKTTVFIKDTTSSWLSRSGSAASRIKPHSYFSKTKTSIPIGSPGSVCAIVMATGMWISWRMMISAESSSGRMMGPAHFDRDKSRTQKDYVPALWYIIPPFCMQYICSRHSQVTIRTPHTSIYIEIPRSKIILKKTRRVDNEFSCPVNIAPLAIYFHRSQSF